MALQLPAVTDSGRRQRPVAPERVLIRSVRTAGPERTVVLVEQSPTVRPTHWHFGHVCTYVLSMPGLMFAMTFWRGDWEQLFAFVLKGPFKGPDTELFHLPLPNIFSSGKVCMGSPVESDRLTTYARSASGWEAKAQVVLRHFWSSHFNGDMVHRLRSDAPKAHPALASLKSWETASRADVRFIERANWAPAGRLGGISFDE